LKAIHRYAIILGILRKNTFMLRDDFFRQAEKHFDFIDRGDNILQMNLKSLEQKKLISIDRVGRGTRARIVSIRLTEQGLFEIVRGQMIGVIKEARIALPKEKPKPKVKPMPCGQVMNQCYMSGCYLAHKCPLKQKVTA
jgi:DNA-binding PadR family transcriptional regulator